MVVRQSEGSANASGGSPLSFATAAFRACADARPTRSLRVLGMLCGAAIALLGFSRATQDANANGETRSLTMHHAHTNELLTITFKRDGSFDSSALEKLNWFLRDWRVDEPISMAPQLFDIIWFVYREVGASEPIKVMSAYRSPGTNAMLRRRSRAVAKESQHMRGNAMDIHIPGVSMAKVREIGMRLQRGGVGYYPSAGSPFVHLDVGSVRSWPRMPREQLERLFPDGKTVHLPADGVPLANYQAALAEVQARGGSALDYETVTSNRGKSLWALLFGGDEDEDIARDVGRGGRNARVAARGRGSAPPEQVASLPTGDGPNAWGVAAVAPVQPTPRVAIAPPQPRREEIVTASPPEPAPAPAAAAPAVQPEAQRTPLQVASLPIPPIRPKGAQFASLVAAADPLPPIRPSGLGGLALSAPSPAVAPATAEPAAVAQTPVAQAPVALAAVGNVPLPPTRPALPAADPAPAPSPAAAAPAPLVAVANMPLPPARPAVPAAESSPPPGLPTPPAQVAVANVPRPPLRPALPAAEPPARAAAALPAIVSRSAEPEPPPAPVANAYAALPAPVPPSRPGFPPVPVASPAPPPPAPVTTAAPAPAVAPAAGAPVPAAATAPAKLREPRPAFIARPTNPMALVAERPATEARPAHVTPVAEPPVAREVNSAVTASRFSASGTQVSAGGFSGGFIRQFGASFTRTGE